MKKISIDGMKVNNNIILVDKYKLLFGFNANNKFKIRNSIKRYFDKDQKTEYEIEKNIRNSVLINDRYVDLRNTELFEINELYDLKEDTKLGTKSILQKYYDLLLDKIEYNEIYTSIANLLKSLEDEIDLQIPYDNINLIGEISDLTKKALVKMINVTTTKDELVTSPYLLEYEETILIQLNIVEKMARLDTEKEYLVMLNIPVLSKQIYNKISHEVDNLTILVFTYILDDIKDVKLDNIAIIDDDIYDLQNEEQLYDISLTLNENISIAELKEKYYYMHIKSINNVVKKII